MDVRDVWRDHAHDVERELHCCGRVDSPPQDMQQFLLGPLDLFLGVSPVAHEGEEVGPEDDPFHCLHGDVEGVIDRSWKCSLSCEVVLRCFLGAEGEEAIHKLHGDGNSLALELFIESMQSENADTKRN